MRNFKVTLQFWSRMAQGSSPEEAFKSLGYPFPIILTPKGKNNWSIKFKDATAGHDSVYYVEEIFDYK